MKFKLSWTKKKKKQERKTFEPNEEQESELPHSMIRAFTVRMMKFWVTGYP